MSSNLVMSALARLFGDRCFLAIHTMITKNVEETSSWSSSCNMCDIITLNISYINVQVL